MESDEEDRRNPELPPNNIVVLSCLTHSTTICCVAFAAFAEIHSTSLFSHGQLKIDVVNLVRKFNDIVKISQN